MSGSKTLHNTSKSAIDVTLIGRIGSEPGKDGKSVSINLKAGETKSLVYGDDQNPYLNAIQLSWNDGNSQAAQQVRILKRGDSGTIDNTLNAFGTLKFNFDPETAKFDVDKKASI